MNTITTLGEIRPSTTGYHAELTIPLLTLRGHDRQVIQPDQCRITDCLVCTWRKAGLLDHPTSRVLRDPAPDYSACQSSYCPGCNTVRCVCSAHDAEDALAEHSYELGHEHGLADGPDYRPTTDWLSDADLDAESYWQGYDDACAGLPVGMPAVLPERLTTPVLWDDLDDDLPF